MHSSQTHRYRSSLRLCLAPAVGKLVRLRYLAESMTPARSGLCALGHRLCAFVPLVTSDPSSSVIICNNKVIIKKHDVRY